MALSAAAKRRLEVALASIQDALEIGTAVDSSTALFPSTAGVAEASKAVVLGASKEIATITTMTVTTLTVDAIAGGDSSLGIDGQAAAQGGAIVITGGASSTATNAGGAVTLKGGTGNTSGAGGAANLTGGNGGSTGVGGQVNVTGGTPTDAAGGAVVIAGGAGVGTNRAGGLASVTGGASTGSATGGVASLVGGAAGAATGVGGGVAITGGAGNTTGAGGAVTITGGAGGNDAVGAKVDLIGGAAGGGNRGGGSIVLTPGAKAGSGIAGGNFLRSATAMHFEQRAAAVAKTDAAEVLTAAEMINGIVVHTVSTGRTLTTPTGAQISAGCPADLAVGDCFYLHVITVGTGADDISTLTAGDGNVTFVGRVTVGPDAANNNGYGTFLFRNTASNTWVGYRVG